MAEREFASAKSLLTALSGRTRNAKKAGTSSSTAQERSSTSSSAVKSGRRLQFDDKSGPPPPRGSLTKDKLSYLDWRLKRINHVRQKSEGSSQCWIDGRSTIGRTSIDVGHSRRIDVVQEARVVPPSKPKKRVPSSMAAFYEEEKVAGLNALEQAYNDGVLFSMPRLSKRDSSSGSEMSGSSDQHASNVPAVALHATSDKDVGGHFFTKPKVSLLSRAGFSKKKHAPESTESRRSIARIWNR